MPSLYWNICPEEAYTSKYCYEYAAQKQFFREAKQILKKILFELEKFNGKFNNDSTEKSKALWMILNDSTHTLLEINELLELDKHSIAGKLFRTIDELLDLSILLHEETTEKYLKKWFNDEIIEHSKYRNFMGKKYGSDVKLEIRDWHRNMSKFTHRTYISLRYSYIVGDKNQIAYDFFDGETTLTYKGTPSMYISILAIYIQKLKRTLLDLDIIKNEKIETIWEESIEKETIKSGLQFT